MVRNSLEEIINVPNLKVSRFKYLEKIEFNFFQNFDNKKLYLS